MSWGQPWTEDFNSDLASSYTTGTQTLTTGDWYTVSVFEEDAANSYGGSGAAARINDDTGGASLRTPAMNTVETVSFYYRELNSGGGTFSVERSYDNSSWTELATQSFSGTSFTQFTYDVNDDASQVYIRIVSDNQAGHLIIDEFSVTAYTVSGPTLTTSESSLTGFTYEEGNGPSGEQSFDLTGSDLDGTDVTITPPTNYEISLSSGSGFQSTAITLSSYDGSTTPVYVRLKAGLSAGTYNSETITVSGGGATDETVTCDGEVFPPTFTLSTSSLTGFTYEEGSGPSAEQSFDLDGSGMDGSDVTVTPPTNYEISLSSGSGFQSTAITLSSYDGSTTPVYVRLKAGLAVGTYNGETIDITGGGADAVSVTCDGEVTPLIISSEDFESCPPSDWIIYSVASSEDWTCGSGYEEINNYNADEAADDWLISPAINLDNYTSEILTFETYKQYADDGISNPETKLYYSTDYSGSGDPSSSTWTELTYNYPNDDSQTWTASGDVDLSGITGSSVYIAFQHVSSGTGGGSTSLWRVDNFEITGTSATPCSEPANQPTALDLNDNTTYNSIDGSFTASTGTPAAHGYLVVRSESSTLSTDPQDATSYSAGDALGGGTVVYSGSSTSFTATGLSESTQYYFFVFAYQNTACSGGPDYLTTSPLSGDETTATGPAISLGTLADFGDVCVESTAGPHSFSLDGTNLTTDDIQVGALSGFEYSTSSGGPFTSTLTISGHGGGTYSTTIYVQFTPVSDIVYDGNIPVSGAGITGTENCAATGTGLALPTITSTTPGSVCNSGTVDLSATASAGTLNWYDVASGGSSLYAGSTFTTPSISSTTSYWVDATDGNGCTSDRTEVVATVTTTPSITSSLTASGTTGNAFSYTITGTESPTSFDATNLPDGLSINTSSGEISGTPTTAGTTDVTISATNACGTGSETLVIEITEFTYNAGDYRSTADGSFSTDNPTGTTDYWEYFDGSSWGTTPSDDGPAHAGTTPARIIVKHVVSCSDNASKTYNDIVVRSGGALSLTEVDIPPVAAEFVAAGKSIEVMNGGELIIQGDIDLPGDASFIVRDGGTLTIDHSNMDNVHPMWDGVENYEAGSTVKILDWDFGASATVASLVNIANAIANNAEGYKFGYLIYDIDAGIEDWAVIGGGIGIIDLVYNDFTIDNAGSGYCGGITNRSGTNGYVVNGNLIINSGSFNFSATYSGDEFEHQAYINGDFEFNSTGNLIMHRNGNNTATTLTKTTGSFVHFKGDVTVNSAATFTNELAADNTRMYMVINGSGTEADPQLLDIGVTSGMTGINTYITNNTFAKLASNNWIFNGISGLTTGITLETGSSMHFGWADDGTTPLTITMPGGAVGTNTITTETGTALYMTHAQGLDDGTNLTNGNVQQFAQANRSFNQTADFWYVGKENQVTGNGITTASTNKLLGVDMSAPTLETTLSNDITTSGKLILKSGVLKTTDTELFTLEDNATVHTDVAGTNGEPGSHSSWVDGPFKKVGDDAFVFPLGENIWGPIGISAPSVVTDEFVGEYFNVAYTDIVNIEATMDHVSNQDYWDITSVVGSSLPTVTGYWKDDRYGIADIANVVIAHYDVDIWKDMGSQNASGTTTDGSVQNSDAFSFFSPITLGFKDETLPVELIDFDAVRVGEYVDVSWTTASETNNDYFTVERSADGKRFEFVTDCQGAGNSNAQNNYMITDYTPYDGISYYRLKQTDFDKAYAYSNIVAVRGVDELNSPDINIWQEKSGLFVEVINQQKDSECYIRIVDITGRILYNKRHEKASEIININLDTNDIAEGLYNVTVISGDKIKTRKFVW